MDLDGEKAALYFDISAARMFYRRTTVCSHGGVECSAFLR